MLPPQTDHSDDSKNKKGLVEDCSRLREIGTWLSVAPARKTKKVWLSVLPSVLQGALQGALLSSLAYAEVDSDRAADRLKFEQAVTELRSGVGPRYARLRAELEGLGDRLEAAGDRA